MTGHQKIAKKNLTNAFNWIVGGYYNAILDECFDDTEAPYERRENLFKEIYDSVMVDDYRLPGTVLYDAPVYSMRFAGKNFIRNELNSMLDNDSDAQFVINWRKNENIR